MTVQQTATRQIGAALEAAAPDHRSDSVRDLDFDAVANFAEPVASSDLAADCPIPGANVHGAYRQFGVGRPSASTTIASCGQDDPHGGHEDRPQHP